jgi:hypothetical protein
MQILQKIVSSIIIFVLVCAVVLSATAYFCGDFSVDGQVSPAYAIDTDANSGQSSAYVGVDVKGVFSSDGTSDGNGLTKGIIEIIRFIVSYILLPLGIIFSLWRVVYLAICPMMLSIDPLDMMSNQRYKVNDNKVTKVNIARGAMETHDSTIAGTSRAILDSYGGKATRTPTTKTDASFYKGVYYNNNDVNAMPENAKKCIMKELRNMFLGLFVTFTAWTIVQLLCQIAIIMLNTSEGVAQNVSFTS